MCPTGDFRYQPLVFVPKRVDLLAAVEHKHKQDHLASFIYSSSQEATEGMETVEEHMHADELGFSVMSV